MAHLIDTAAFVVTNTANSATRGKDSYGAVPWHGLGTFLPQVATADEMYKAAFPTDWFVNTEKIFDADMNEVEDFRITRRSDTRKILGVVGKDYVPFQNIDAFRMIDELTIDPNGPKYEAAGSLDGGRRVWALARMPEWMDVLPGDAIGTYILVTTGHDGKNAIRVMLTNIRVVCANTLTMATADETTGVTISHVGNVVAKVDNVRDLLGMITKEQKETLELYQHLTKINPTPDQLETVLRGVFGEKASDAKRDRSGAKIAQVRELMEVGAGTDIKGVQGTAWGVWNAITEYCDHIHGVTSKKDDANDKRLESMWYGGTIQTRKKVALDLLCKC